MTLWSNCPVEIDFLNPLLGEPGTLVLMTVLLTRRFCELERILPKDIRKYYACECCPISLIAFRTGDLSKGYMEKMEQKAQLETWFS
jgi:hypothetical protein